MISFIFFFYVLYESSENGHHFGNIKMKKKEEIEI